MYPSLLAVRGLEEKTLKSITRIGAFGRIGALRAEASQALTELASTRAGVNVHLGFTLDVRLRGENEATQRRVDIGALVEADAARKAISNCSYSVLICQGSDVSSVVMRKMHFDYEPVELRHLGEPKPSVHMQVCGKLSRHHLGRGYKEEQIAGWFPAIEKPRVPVLPTSLALVLNWIFLEFRTDVGARAVLDDHEWRNVVVEAERAVLSPYFEQSLSFLKSTARAKSRFCQRFLYGLDEE